MTAEKKTKKLNCVIPLVVYPFDVMFSFNQTDDELRKNLKQKGVTGQEDLWKMKSEILRGRCCVFKVWFYADPAKIFP